MIIILAIVLVSILFATAARRHERERRARIEALVAAGRPACDDFAGDLIG